MRRFWILTPAVLMPTALLVALLARATDAGRHIPPEREMVDGAPMYTLLDWGDIPSIDAPRFVPASEADAFMADDELVIGVTDPSGGNARCYSLLHLDQHEVVNDQVGEAPIAVTW